MARATNEVQNGLATGGHHGSTESRRPDGRDRAFSANRLAFFLLDPHPKMPDMQLTRVEAQDLAAYIKGLR